MDELKKKLLSREDLYQLANHNPNVKLIKKAKKINQTL